MGAFRDITGQRFGRLVAIKRVGATPWKHVIWLCICDCGNFAKVIGSRLINGRTKSCGCLVHNWKGNPATYETAHWNLCKIKPQPELCERCKERPAAELSYNGDNGEWSINSEDYEWLCGSCHRFKDRGKGNGIIMTEAKIDHIRKIYDTKEISQEAIGELFNVGATTIANIINYRGIYKRRKK